MIFNKIQIDDIRFRTEHCKGTNQDCKDLLEHIDVLQGGIDCEGSVIERMIENVSEFVDVDVHYDLNIDRKGLAKYLKRVTA